MAGLIDMMAADLASVIQEDIKQAVARILSMAVAVNVGTGSVTIRDSAGERVVAKGVGSTIRPGDVVIVARQGRTEVAITSITVPGVAEPVIEGDWASITAALDGKVDKDEYEVDQTLHALTHTNLQTAIDAKVAQGDYDTAMVANATAHTTLQTNIDAKLASANVVRKRLATSVTTTSSSFQGVSGLSLTVAAGETWLATWVLVSETTANGQANLSVPSGTTIRGAVQGDGLWANALLVTGAGGYALDGDGLVSGGVLRIEASLLVTTSGTVQPQIKSENGTDQASIAAGSFLVAHRL